MPAQTLVIAEPGMTWDRDPDKAYRLIDAAAACGANICKFQWTSNGRKIQERRQVDPKYISIYERGVQYPVEWLEKFKARCESVGLEFMVTTYLIEDISVVAPLVKRFKVSAFEARWREFVRAHYEYKREIIVSLNPGGPYEECGGDDAHLLSILHCISKYPTPIEEADVSGSTSLCLVGGRPITMRVKRGYSDHTANVLTGAAAVAAGASIVEAHIKLMMTPDSNPDAGHSLVCDMNTPPMEPIPFAQYVRNIRTVELML